ncbi:uncharacterized protein LOC144714826 [Wolffia australiana]
MRCISWNVRGLRDAKRRGIVGKYLREWGATVVCLQETMLEDCGVGDWCGIGGSLLEGFIVVNVNGRSGGVVIAWNEAIFRKEAWRGQFTAAVRLTRSDGLGVVIASVYGPVNASLREGLWVELAELVDKFRRMPLLFGGDFNVTLGTNDRPNGGGGRDQGSEEFWAFLVAAGLQEMGPIDCCFTWRSSYRAASKSRLDRFLCSVELMERFPGADVRALSRPISDHIPIMWQSHEGHGRTTYFKIDKSWLREGGFKEEVKGIWRTHSEQESGANRLAIRIDGLRDHLKSYKRRIKEARCRVRIEALTRIRELDEVEDNRI